MEEAMPSRREPCRGKAVVRPGGRVLVVAVLCGLMLSGCGDFSDMLADIFRVGGKAEAQDNPPIGDEKLIETFRISPETFQLDADTIPQVDVTDSATRYQMLSDGVVSFSLQGGALRTFDLKVGDVVVERPGQNLVTVVKDRNQ
jgi:hypothetical protein